MYSSNRTETLVAVSKILFEADPANTCCVENDCVDEYDYITLDIVDGRDTINNLLSQEFGTRIEVNAEVEQKIKGLLDEFQKFS